VATWEDGDGDGYGDGDPETGCPSEHRATIDGDCDDSDPAVNPGAIEYCADGVDQDCNGLTDIDDCSLTTGRAVIVGALADAGLLFGSAGAGGVDVDSDGVPDFVGTAPWAGAAYGFSGAVLRAAGNDFRVLAEDAAFVLDESHNGGGAAVALGDVDGDGVGDVLLGAPAGSLESPPRVGLRFGPLSRGVLQPDARVFGADPDGAFGSFLAVKDVDADGGADLLVGAYNEEGQCGALYALWSPLPAEDRDVAELVGEGAALRVAGECGAGGSADFRGAAAAWILGPGDTSIVIGAPGTDAVRQDEGAVLIFRDVRDPGGEVDAAEADELVAGENEIDSFGAAVAVGDFDGDGHPDLAVGATQADGEMRDSGGVYLFLAVDSPGFARSAREARTFLMGPAAEDSAPPAFGQTVVAPGDLDGDGREELLVGSPSSPGLFGSIDVGSCHLLPGGSVPDGAVAAADVTRGYWGDINGEHVCASAGPLGDIDADGEGDLFVGAPGASDGSGNFVGLFGILLSGDQP
jgi:hypothetical protein